MQKLRMQIQMIRNDFLTFSAFHLFFHRSKFDLKYFENVCIFYSFQTVEHLMEPFFKKNLSIHSVNFIILPPGKIIGLVRSYQVFL